MSYIGGSRNAGIVERTEEEIVRQVMDDVKWVLLKPGADLGEAKLLGCKVWGAAIPQYEIGHLKKLEAIEDEERKVPGLYLGGNWRTGVAVGDCVDFGLKESAKIADFLGK